MQAHLKKLLEGARLSRAEAREAMDALMRGEATQAQIGAFLAALKVRGEAEEELTGFAEALRAHAKPVKIERRPLIDTCGTGGDGSGTFNISTAAALIAASAGAAVAKHGNRSVSSRCGSADVLEALGVKPEVAPELAARCVDDAGVCFLFAPAFHPAMRHAAPVRKELGTRTVFNLLGPLANPAGATRQVLGVFDRKLLPAVARTLQALGSEEAMVVASEDGLDELSISAPTRVAHLANGKVLEYVVTPEDAGLPRHPVTALQGGDAKENARILSEVFEGRAGAARDVCLLNAAAALVVAAVAKDLRQGVRLASEAVDQGKTRRTLETLRILSHADA